MTDTPHRTSPTSIGKSELAAWTDEGTRATREGKFADAVRWISDARGAAIAVGFQEDIDKADLNLAMARLELGECREAEEGLREILLRTADPRIGFTAAYHLASSLRRQGRYESASRYAARALERAEAIDDPDLLAPIRNLCGNLLLARSYPGEAMKHYEASLRIREAQTTDTRWSRAILLDNIGYCLLVDKQTDAGLNRIRAGLELAEAVGDRRCIAECRQDLCYGLLLAGDLTAALRYGVDALSEASRNGYPDIEENCHYLLGEIGSRAGDDERRDAHFAALQRMHPEIPFLSDFLCSVDVTGIITLKR